MIRAIGQAHLFRQRQRASPPLRRRNAQVEHRHLEVFEHRQLLDQVEVLEYEADPLAADLAEPIVRQVTDIDPAEDVPPAGRLIEAAEDVHQRAFAGAAGRP